MMFIGWLIKKFLHQLQKKKRKRILSPPNPPTYLIIRKNWKNGELEREKE